jgi:hypothetical protein
MVTYLVSFLFRPVSEFLFYELFCYLYELYENHHRDAVPVVVNQIDNVEDANETHENDNMRPLKHLFCPCNCHPRPVTLSIHGHLHLLNLLQHLTPRD